MKFKAIIWGIGRLYNRMFNVISYFKMKNQLEIVALTANVLPPYQVIDGHAVIAKEKLGELNFDLLIIMNEKNYDDIVDEAVNICKISRRKIIPYRVLEIPGLDLIQYMKLKESGVSIISNNCWGGIAYNTLGMEVLTPFKDLFVLDDDYIKLLKNLQYYMQCNPCFYKYSVDIHSQEKYPVLLIDDVKIHCNHDKDPQTAIDKWNRRKEKINWSNLFVEMYTENPKTEKAFMELGEIANKICFVPYQSLYPNSFYLKMMPGQKEFWEAVNGNVENGKNAFSYNLIELIQGNSSTVVRSI